MSCVISTSKIEKGDDLRMLYFKRGWEAMFPKKQDLPHLKEAYTPWGEALDPASVLTEHPRPQFARDSVTILNGWWDCAFAVAPAGSTPWNDAKPPDDYEGRILVPFSPESALSGVKRQLKPNEVLWCRRRLPTPALEGGTRCLLHFDAVDHACRCLVNGVAVGSHQGGYLPFSFDVTDALASAPSGEQSTIELCVFDPSDRGVQLRGKQKLDRGGIWYTAQSGIWQPVWLELVPKRHLSALTLKPDLERKRLVATVGHIGGGELTFELYDDDSQLIAQKKERLSEDEGSHELILELDEVHPWSPDDPYLYPIRLRFGEDRLQSYCAFRSLAMGADKRGRRRFFLNGEPLFLRGLLDQGYWPDGLMTAPSDEALIHDITTAKQLGFNLLRKHIKVERERWYYHCDRLGMLVWQDMVTGGGAYEPWTISNKPSLFRRTWTRYRDDSLSHMTHLSSADEGYRKEWLSSCEETIRHLFNHPSIVTWVLFNEGWGQFEARKAARLVRSLDGSRPIDSVSGWFDQSCGDFFSVHNYFRTLEVYPDKGPNVNGWQDPDGVDLGPRAFVLSEFGGLSCCIPEHSVVNIAYGYGNFEDRESWAEAVRMTLAQADALEANGLAGYVYTQVSDVEEETNGILSYDRRINKLDPSMNLD